MAQTPATEPPQCAKQFHQAKYKAYARSVYLHREHIKRSAKRRLERMVRCQHSPEARKNVRHWRRGIWKKRKAWLEVLKVTPYKCGGRRYAVPCYIVQCESRFNPRADNGSHWGYYQLQYSYLHGDFSVANQHRVAASLWKGGAGAGHWVCA